MNQLLKLEEAAQFVLAIILFNQLQYAWYIFPLLLLLPDVSMLGYVFNTKAGAFLYNLFHHKATAVVVLAAGFWLNSQPLLLAGVILLGHAAMDRMQGYGLKYNDDFKHTHLGWIGKKQHANAA